jgi:hypothetical protein
MISNFILAIDSTSCVELDPLGGLTRFYRKAAEVEISWGQQPGRAKLAVGTRPAMTWHSGSTPRNPLAGVACPDSQRRLFLQFVPWHSQGASLACSSGLRWPFAFAGLAAEVEPSWWCHPRGRHFRLHPAPARLLRCQRPTHLALSPYPESLCR